MWYRWKISLTSGVRMPAPSSMQSCHQSLHSKCKTVHPSRLPSKLPNQQSSRSSRSTSHCVGSWSLWWIYSWATFCLRDTTMQSLIQQCNRSLPIPRWWISWGSMLWWFDLSTEDGMHPVTTITMLVRNKTMDRWFSGKSEEAQGKLLKLSARHGKELWRQQHQNEHDAVAQTTHPGAKQAVTWRQKNGSDAEEEWHHQKSAAALKDAQSCICCAKIGPCPTPDDGDHLLQRFGLQQEHRATLQVEMNHHKVVLGVKSPLLPSIIRLAENLRNYLQGHVVAVQVPADPVCAG